MIGSFWNLCRACPSMPVDKQLHSEYRSTYRWHEFTGSARPEVVRRPPAPNPNQFTGPTNEPPLPRRKKCPELAYKSHEFIIGGEYTDLQRANIGGNRMARSEERGGTPSRRSKSEGPPVVPNGRAYPIAADAIDGTGGKQAGESNGGGGGGGGLFKKTITKLSTEYRCKFVWPNVRRIKGPEANDQIDHHKRSQLQQQLYPQQPKSQQQPKQQQQQHHQQQQQQHLGQKRHFQNMMATTMTTTASMAVAASMALPMIHKKRTTNQKEATQHELEPLVNDTDDKKPQEKHVSIVEKKVTVRPLSQAYDQERINHFITRKENFGFADEVDNQKKVMMNGSSPPRSQPNLDLWFKEMIELRKKADEYKCRGWGIEIDPDMYKKQKDLWDQVSKRESLSALSLASSVHRPFTKEEKEQENSKKTAPVSKATAHKARVPGQAYFVDNKEDMTALPARFNYVRHHLERTTGPDVEEGALLPSPTREKLMPAITKRESESQRGSPKKTAVSRHGSPQKGSPQKGSPKKIVKTRSQSAGPAVIENESPKRRLRSASQAPTARAGKKSQIAGRTGTGTGTGIAAGLGATTTATSASTERKPRPSTLSATFQSRIKSSSMPPPTSGRAQHNHLLINNQSQSSQPIDKMCKSPQPIPQHQQQQLQQQQQRQQQTSQQLRKKDKDKLNRSSVSGVSLNKIPKARPKSTIGSRSGAGGGDDGIAVGKFNGEMMGKSLLMVPGQDNKLAENDAEDGRETAISVSSCSPHVVPEISEEPLVKSPPEPTRVKSPEQIIMRSPDPVNWTVPLDTGKTFTVTQNVKEGENYSRPQSEIKASTPVEKPPPPPQSAPPQLTEQAKMDAWKSSDPFEDPKSSLSSSTPTSTIGKVTTTQPMAGSGGLPSAASIQSARFEAKPVPGSTLRCLDDPMFDVGGLAITTAGALVTSSSAATTTASSARTTAADVLEKARDRFDRFWGGNGGAKEENV